ncbi:hypothetical protein RI367_006416 [Sorochytrium milnesiophthora]
MGRRSSRHSGSFADTPRPAAVATATQQPREQDTPRPSAATPGLDGGMWKLVQTKQQPQPQTYDFFSALRAKGGGKVAADSNAKIRVAEKSLDEVLDGIDAPQYHDFSASAAADDMQQEDAALHAYFERHQATPSIPRGVGRHSPEQSSDVSLEQTARTPASDVPEDFATPRPKQRTSRRNSIFVSDMTPTQASYSPVPDRLSLSELSTGSTVEGSEEAVAPQDDTSAIQSSRLSTASSWTNSSIASTDRIIEAGQHDGRTAPPLTVPKEFSFLKRHPLPKRNLNLKSTNSPMIKKRLKAFRKNGLTVPKPFNLHTSTSAGRAPLQAATHADESIMSQPPASPFVPLAIKVQKFGGTPERFKPIVKSKKVVRRILMQHRGLTKPQSPKLLTKMRAKPINLPTTEEKELAELRAIKPFAAKPADERILHGTGMLGVPHVPKHMPTVPESPAITKPRPKTDLPAKPEHGVAFHAQPLPNLSQPQVLKRPEPRPSTKPEPFHLRGEAMHSKAIEQIAEVQRQEAEQLAEMRKFVAHPAPHSLDSPDRLPHVEPRKPTSPVPFALSADTFGEENRRKVLEAVDAARAEEERLRQFHAQPIPDSMHVPFVPHKSRQPLTEVADITLHSEERAHERAAYDQLIHDKREQEEQVRAEQRKQQEAEERKAVKRLRETELVHKPVPVPDFKPMVIKPSSKPRTVPESPMIGAKRKRVMQELGVDAPALASRNRKKRGHLKELNLAAEQL